MRTDSTCPSSCGCVRSAGGIVVTITDQGGEHAGGDGEVETPDLLEKLEGRQRPRGWGLFLIEKMVDAHAGHDRGPAPHRPAHDPS